MHARGLKDSEKQNIPTQVALRVNGRDRTKTDDFAGSQRATVQSQVIFATSKPSKTTSTRQKGLPPTNGGKFEVPHFANTHNLFLTSQVPTNASGARHDHYNRTSFPKLKLL